MYCSNCGKEMLSGAEICTNCGFQARTGNKYCSNCGEPIQEGQAMCIRCGNSLVMVHGRQAGGKLGSVPKDQRVLCGILSLLLTLGIQNFILGETKQGILHILLVGISIFFMLFGDAAWIDWMYVLGQIIVFGNAIWSIIEGIRILTGTYTVKPNAWFNC